MRPLYRLPSNQIGNLAPQTNERPRRERKAPQRLGFEADAALTTADREGPYQARRGTLIKWWGRFCAYCEMPVGTNSHVEHKVPKSRFADPLSANDWPNLLLSCPRCNTIKNDNFNESVTYAWPDQTVVFSPDPTKSSYIYTMVPPVNLIIFKPSDRLNIPQGVFQTAPLVIVTAGPENTAAAQNLLDLVKLNNDYDPMANSISAPNSSSDQMIFARSRTWTAAQRAVQNLKAVYIAYPDDIDIINAMHRQVVATAVATGFWSVWMTVFWNALQTHELVPPFDTPETDYMDALFVTGFPQFLLNFPNIAYNVPGQTDRLVY